MFGLLHPHGCPTRRAAWVSCTHRGDPQGGPGSGLQPGPASAAVAIWGVNQSMENLLLFLCLCKSFKQKNKSKISGRVFMEFLPASSSPPKNAQTWDSFTSSRKEQFQLCLSFCRENPIRGPYHGAAVTRVRTIPCAGEESPSQRNPRGTNKTLAVGRHPHVHEPAESECSTWSHSRK